MAGCAPKGMAVAVDRNGNPAQCVQVLLEGDSRPLVSVPFKDSPRVIIGVTQGALSNPFGLGVRAFLSPDCTGTPSYTSPYEPHDFSESLVILSLPGAGSDGGVPDGGVSDGGSSGRDGGSITQDGGSIGQDAGPLELCGDGVDNDFDGRADCADTDCAGQVCNDGFACTSLERCLPNAAGVVACRNPMMTCQDSNLGPCRTQCFDGMSCGFVSNVSCEDDDPCTDTGRCGAGACMAPMKQCPTTAAPDCVAASGCSRDAGCFVQLKPPGAACDDGNPCTLPGTCVVDGGCTAGQALTDTACPAGVCVAGQCAPLAVTPSNVRPSLAAMSPPTGWTLANGCTVRLNTNLLTEDAGLRAAGNCMTPAFAWSEEVQTGSTVPAIVIRLSSFTIAAGARLETIGERPLIFLSSGPINVDGLLYAGPVDIGTGVYRSGAGGNVDPWCVVGRGTLSPGGPGAGGGGFGSIGGRGGASAVQNGVMASGLEGTPELTPLRGGCAGGGVSNLADYGRAGGAVQLTSQVSINITGLVTAPGLGGRAANALNAGGGGGGSGGAFLLEAPTVTLSSMGWLTANGGGGASGFGGGGSFFSSPGADGRQASVQSAPGGVAQSGSWGGPGGVGAALNAAAGNGLNSSSSGGGGGGGGGGVGRIRINAMSCSGLARMSPAPSLSSGLSCAP